jgi:hypothetical protein
VDTLAEFRKLCQACGTNPAQLSMSVCSSCRHSSSKQPCPVDGCGRLMSLQAKSCTFHRHLFLDQEYTICCECGGAMSRRYPVCLECHQHIYMLCACGCGRYRLKYGARGQVCLYITGHNDNWHDLRPPPKTCDYCGTLFKAGFSRQRLCSISCRGAWFKLNPPRATKQIRVECAACGQIIFRVPHQRKGGRLSACSKKCQYIIAANKAKLAGRITLPKRLASLRDGGQCRLCRFAVIIEVHHILAKKHGGKDVLENLITLCPNHHTMADRGLIAKEKLQKMVADATFVPLKPIHVSQTTFVFE